MKNVRKTGVFQRKSSEIYFYGKIKKVLNSKLFPFVFLCFSQMVPQNYQKLESEEHIKLMEKLIDIMEEDDDVQNIWHNWEE